MTAPPTPRRVALAAVGVGVGLGVTYTLSPLTVIALSILAPVAWWAGLGLSPRQRRWFVSLAAMGVRALNLLRGRQGGITRRQIAYLYRDVLVDSAPVREELGWAPEKALSEQVGS